VSTQTSYSNARANLAALLDQVAADHEIVIISRRGAEDVAMVAASELSGLIETAHLLRSPANAWRLLRALKSHEIQNAEATTFRETTTGDGAWGEKVSQGCRKEYRDAVFHPDFSEDLRCVPRQPGSH